MRRVIFDTNIWQYLAADADAARLDRELRRLGYTICVPPATVVELGMNPDPITRRQALRLVSHHRWASGRLEPEVLMECRELAALIGATCPDLLRRPADHATESDQLRFWTEDIYADAAHLPQGLRFAGQRSERVTGRTPDKYAAMLKATKRQVSAGNLITELSGQLHVRLDAPEVPAHLDGYAAHAFGVWLLGQMSPILAAISGPRATPAMQTWKDWMSCLLDLSAVKAEWEHVTESLARATPTPELAVSWMRWATVIGQTRFKVGHGSAGDNQLSLYLPAVDLLVTADKGLAGLLDTVRPYSPSEFARVALIAAPATGGPSNYAPVVLQGIAELASHADGGAHR